MRKRVIFLCVNNSCRSQMAEGILRHLSSGRIKVYSAGSDPTTVNKSAVKVLKEIGIDISGQFSKSVDNFELSSFDYIVTTCDEVKETCLNVTAGAKMIHLNLNDPASLAGSEEEILSGFRKVRDEIVDFAKKFIDAESDTGV